MAKPKDSTDRAKYVDKPCGTCGKVFQTARFYSTTHPGDCVYCHRPPISAEEQKKRGETRKKLAKTAPKELCKRCEKPRAKHLLQNGLCIGCLRKTKIDERNAKAVESLNAQTEAVKQAVPVIETPVFTVAATTQAELAAREIARRRLLHFTKRFNAKYDAGWVHEDICRRLERFVQDVAAGRSPRLLLCMPPRTGKSELASRKFPAWVLGQHPDWEIISASHTQSLAMSFSRHIRDTLRDPSYQAVFPDGKLDPDSQSVENWMTTSGGGYLAAGIGSGITGRGAHILLIDDPVKNMEEADSQTVRDNTWEWYTSTAYTRLAPGGGVLGIMTLWNDDDWGGRIITASESGEGDKFEIVRYPAINEGYDEYLGADDEIVKVYPGNEPPVSARLLRPADTALHPARYDTDYLLKIKKNFYATGSGRTWSALYQQNPAPEEGAFFTKDMMRYYSTAPRRSECYVYQAWDFAISEKNQSDWTVCSTMAQDPNDALYELDLERFRTGNSFIIVDAILDQYERHRPDLLGFEDGQIWKSIKALFERRCQERKLYPSYEVLQPLTDKMVRAGPLRGRMQMGKVYYHDIAPYKREADQEMLRFPAGKHDDVIDARAWCVRLTLSKAAPARKEPAKIKGWRDRLGEIMGSGSAISHMAA